MSWRKPRYRAVLIGLESGHKHSMESLFSFRTMHEAIIWAAEMNEKDRYSDLGLTKWAVEEIPEKIQYVDGIPRWFTWLHHWYEYFIFCRRSGHTTTQWDSCDRCGENLPS